MNRIFPSARFSICMIWIGYTFAMISNSIHLKHPVFSFMVLVVSLAKIHRFHLVTINDAECIEIWFEIFILLRRDVHHFSSSLHSHFRFQLFACSHQLFHDFLLERTKCIEQTSLFAHTLLMLVPCTLHTHCMIFAQYLLSYINDLNLFL